MDYFKNVPRLDLREIDTIHRFGITSDIIAYRLCPRSYGYFKARNFTSSSAIQLFFGTVLHEVFDQAHLHYAGKIHLGDLKIKTKNKNKTSEDIIERMKEILQELVEEGVLDANQIKDTYENELPIPTPIQLGTAFINVEPS